MNRSYSRHHLCFISDGSFGWAAHAKINPTCSGGLNMNQSFPYTHFYSLKRRYSEKNKYPQIQLGREKQHTASSRRGGGRQGWGGTSSGLTSGSSSPRPSTQADQAIPAAASACGDSGLWACRPARVCLPDLGGRKASTPADIRARGT